MHVERNAIPTIHLLPPSQNISARIPSKQQGLRIEVRTAYYRKSFRVSKELSSRWGKNDGEEKEGMASMLDHGEGAGVVRQRRKFILCFDGTGNKFQGTAGDSNILKIYSMLDRTDKTQFHYYQPGIGTYTTSHTLSTKSAIARLSSWYNKAKDSAVGTTLDEHVMAGYRFLMRYYQEGDDIYFFGFSRGAYIARFLAEMLDHVGLLSAGNEELVRFVWKTFARWQRRSGGNGKAKEEELQLFRFMKGFRETFSRPVRRIRFLGLFDTVNSVSKFETAWMRRSNRFPYTARSSAVKIRHAVAIDERRAKFRQDLISPRNEKQENSKHLHLSYFRRRNAMVSPVVPNGRQLKARSDDGRLSVSDPRPQRFRSVSRGRSHSHTNASIEERKSFQSCRSEHTNTTRQTQELQDDDDDDEDEDEKTPQSVEEIWFPGCHADIGGGWEPEPPESLSLSHGPLVWMVREAQKAGLVFNNDKLQELCCYYEDQDFSNPAPQMQQMNGGSRAINIPTIEVNDGIIPADPPRAITMYGDEDYSYSNVLPQNWKFVETLHKSCTRGPIHDPLQRHQGTPTLGVLSWNIMEFLPFKRMDLRPDGTWMAISWPLPMGETRDIPDDVKIHHTVIQRMRHDRNYRPGNLIVGGGGRGRRRAPEEKGMGDWEVVEEGKGHPVDEIWVRAKKVEVEKDA